MAQAWQSITLKQLRAFAVLSDCESMAEAADLLGISYPTISEQIKSLEKALGGPLFFRGPSGVELTTEGRALREHVRPPLQELDSVLRSACTPDRDCRVATAPGVPWNTLEEACERLHVPPDAVQWVDAPSSSHARLLKTRTVQAAIGREPNLTAELLDAPACGVVVGPSSPLRTAERLRCEDLDGATLIWFDEKQAPNYAAEVLNHLHTRNCTPRLRSLPARQGILEDTLKRDPAAILLRPRADARGRLWIPLDDPPVDRIWLSR